MSISQSCKAYIKIIKLGGIIQKTQRGTGFQLNFQDLSKRLTSSHIVLQRFEANFQPAFGTLNYRTTDFKLGFKGA